MSASLMGSVRELLARQAVGALSEAEQAVLAQSARTLRRRLERLRALYPDIQVSLCDELDALAKPSVLSASN